jgi:hypothetical protein
LESLLALEGPPSHEREGGQSHRYFELKANVGLNKNDLQRLHATAREGDVVAIHKLRRTERTLIELACHLGSLE